MATAAEEGDDEPLIPSKTHARPRPERPAPTPREPREAAVEAPAIPQDDTPYAELFLGIGRRDGTRAQDILRSLVEVAGIDKDHIRRIRVRDRHAFVSIRKDQAEQAIARLNGNTVAGKPAVVVELARERGAVDDGPAEAPVEN